MTKRESSSSVPVAKLKAWDEIAALGRRIVQGLKLSPHSDSLRAWMAHYVAELLANERACTNHKRRASLRKQCAELITRLWSIRYQFDPSDPISELNRNIRVLVGDDIMNRPRVDCSDTTGAAEENCETAYEQTLRQIALVSKKESAVMLSALTAGLVEELSGTSSGDEDGHPELDISELLRFRKRVVDNDDALLTAIEEAETDSARQEAVAEALWDLSKERRRLIKTLGG